MGLDAAGKTTILYKLKLGEIVTTIPTIGASLPAPPSRGLLLLLRSKVAVADPFDKFLLLLSRLQRGDRRVQEHQLHRVGCGWPGQGVAHSSSFGAIPAAGAGELIRPRCVPADPPAVEALLPKHAGPDLRGGQQRS